MQLGCHVRLRLPRLGCKLRNHFQAPRQQEQQENPKGRWASRRQNTPTCFFIRADCPEVLRFISLKRAIFCFKKINDLLIFLEPLSFPGSSKTLSLCPSLAKTLILGAVSKQNKTKRLQWDFHMGAFQSSHVTSALHGAMTFVLFHVWCTFWSVHRLLSH